MAEVEKPRVVGFNHIALEVGDIDEALAFYMLRANCRRSDSLLWQSARHMLKKRWPRRQVPGPMNHRPGAVGGIIQTRRNICALGVH